MSVLHRLPCIGVSFYLVLELVSSSKNLGVIDVTELFKLESYFQGNVLSSIKRLSQRTVVRIEFVQELFTFFSYVRPIAPVGFLKRACWLDTPR